MLEPPSKKKKKKKKRSSGKKVVLGAISYSSSVAQPLRVKQRCGELQALEKFHCECQSFRPSLSVKHCLKILFSSSVSSISSTRAPEVVSSLLLLRERPHFEDKLRSAISVPKHLHPSPLLSHVLARLIAEHRVDLIECAWDDSVARVMGSAVIPTLGVPQALATLELISRQPEWLLHVAFDKCSPLLLLEFVESLLCNSPSMLAHLLPSHAGFRATASALLPPLLGAGTVELDDVNEVVMALPDEATVVQDLLMQNDEELAEQVAILLLRHPENVHRIMAQVHGAHKLGHACKAIARKCLDDTAVARVLAASPRDAKFVEWLGTLFLEDEQRVLDKVVLLARFPLAHPLVLAHLPRLDQLGLPSASYNSAMFLLRLNARAPAELSQFFNQRADATEREAQLLHDKTKYRVFTF